MDVEVYTMQPGSKVPVFDKMQYTGDMIRQFQSGDALPCCQIIHACLSVDTALSPSLRRKMLKGETPEAIRDRASLFYLAVYESGGRVLGFIGLDMNEIRLLYVSPDYRHRGIGRSLLNHVKSMVPSTLFREIFVYSTPEAVGFYKGCGFTDRGPHAYDLGGECFQTVFMTCPALPDIPV